LVQNGAISKIALSGIISVIKQDIGRKSPFFIPYLHSTPQLGDSCPNIAMAFGHEQVALLSQRGCAMLHVCQ